MSQSGANTLPCDHSSGLPLIDVWQGSRARPILTDKSHRLVDSFVSSVSNFGPITTHKMIPVIPRLILHGPPGTGKSLTALHAFTKLGPPCCFVKLDAVVSPHAGETAKNIRRIFEYACSAGYGIIFDKIDAFARVRSIEDASEANVLTNLFLHLLDGLYDGVPIIAITNRFDLLDPAIFHRFSFQLKIDYPDLGMREKLWYMYYGGAHTNAWAKSLAEISKGLNGADIENISRSSLLYVPQAPSSSAYMPPVNVIRALSKSSTNHCEPCCKDPINVVDIKNMGSFLENQGIDRNRMLHFLNISPEDLDKYFPLGNNASSVSQTLGECKESSV